MSTAPSRLSSRPKWRRVIHLLGGLIRWPGSSTADSDIASAPSLTWDEGAPNHSDIEGSLYLRDDPTSWRNLLYRNIGGAAVWESLGDANMIGERYNLRWVAGQRGKPGLNADINSATEATREVADPDFEILGTNATSASCTYYAEGGITLTTAGADGDSVILLPHLDTNQSAWTQVTWGSDKSVAWECLITTGSNIGNAIVYAGLKLTNTEVTATDNDQVFFRYQNGVNSGKWQAVSSIGGTDDAADSGATAVATGTRYRLRIVIAADRTARMYLNDTLVKTTEALTDATDFIPYIGVKASGAAAAKAIHVHGQAIGRAIG